MTEVQESHTPVLDLVRVDSVYHDPGPDVGATGCEELRGQGGGNALAYNFKICSEGYKRVWVEERKRVREGESYWI